MKTMLLLLLSLQLTQVPPEQIDYRKEFGKDYTWAENWIVRHNAVLESHARAYGLPAKELKAIIFPELVRYNLVFDAIQVESLKYLYVSEGKKYADFSVGYFQMKPSFAEMVEQDAVRILSADFCRRTQIGQWQNAPDSEDARRQRVQRITSVEQQLVYLCAFYKICRQRFAAQVFGSPRDRVRFFATCYNAGYHKTEASILDYQTRKHFYKYNYAEVSVFYFDTAK